MAKTVSLISIIFLPMFSFVLSCTFFSEEAKDYKATKKEDFYSAYEAYLSKYPNGTHVQEARERIAWLKSNKAVVEVDYPKEIEVTTNPDYEGPYWSLTITFKEKGGKIGYKVKGQARFFHSEYFDGMASGTTTEIKVPPGGEAKHTDWWFSKSHKLCNGTFNQRFEGEDAGSNSINIDVFVKNTHKGCPGPQE